MTPASDKRNFDRLDDLRYARIGSARLSPTADLAVSMYGITTCPACQAHDSWLSI